MKTSTLEQWQDARESVLKIHRTLDVLEMLLAGKPDDVIEMFETLFGKTRRAD